MAERDRDTVPIGGMLEGSELARKQRSLLELIDKIQDAQVSGIQLPQIAVVGDQSSGKSSVLEAITREQFPRAAGACTRFATELRLRRGKKEYFKVEIIPDRKTRTQDELDRFAAFGRDLDETTPFSVIMNLATELIAPKNIPGRFAAEDLLVVEMQKPFLPLLTLVDLPGLVQNPNNDQSLEDIKAIEDLTDKYMGNERTIILAVVGGNHDYVHAPILKKARHFDPHGSRTIGVLTKPDLTKSIGLEDKFIELVKNEDDKNRFNLGWFVLLNSPPPEDGVTWPPPEERKDKEDYFFATTTWNVLPSSRRGVNALSQALGEQLCSHIAKNLKPLRKEVQQNLDRTERELYSLGHAKETVEEMKDDLVEHFDRSNTLVHQAVRGDYSNPPGTSFFLKTHDRKSTPAQNLRARVVEVNKEFAKRIRGRGSDHAIRARGSDPTLSAASHGNGVPEPPVTPAKQEYAKKVVEPFLKEHKGVEFFGENDPRLIYELFHKYATNLVPLAREHKDDISNICSEFLGEIISNVWPQQMRGKIRTHFLQPHVKVMRKAAQEELEKIGKDLQYAVQPYTPEYEIRVKEWRAAAAHYKYNYSEAEEFLEKMLIFYELSAQTFLTNIITQVIERHLLQGLSTIFSPLKAHRMKNETVELIAAEKQETRDRRATLRKDRARLEEALDACISVMNSQEFRTQDEDDANEDEQGDENIVTSPAPQPPSPASYSRPPPIAPPTAPPSGISSPAPERPTGRADPPQQPPSPQSIQSQSPPLPRRPIQPIPTTTVDAPAKNTTVFSQSTQDVPRTPIVNELDASPQINGTQRGSWNQQHQHQQYQPGQGPSPQPSPRLAQRQPDGFFAQGWQQQQQRQQGENTYNGTSPQAQFPQRPGPDDSSASQEYFHQPQNQLQTQNQKPYHFQQQQQQHPNPVEVDAQSQERQPSQLPPQLSQPAAQQAQGQPQGRYNAVAGNQNHALSPAAAPAPPGYGPTATAATARRPVSRDVSRERPLGGGERVRFNALPQGMPQG